MDYELREFSKGYFALGLVLGVGATILACVLFVGSDYCPNAPCPSESRWLRLTELLFGENVSLLPPNPGDQQGRNDFYSLQGLKVQGAIARATFASVLVTAFATLFSAVAAILLYKTFKETRSSALAAQQSADVSKETFRLMREGHEREVRAYVSVAKTLVEYDEDKGNFIVKVTFRNSGQTPAKGLVFGAYIVRSCSPKNARFPPSVVPNGSRADLTKGEDFSTEWKKSLSGYEQGFTVGVLIKYNDVFGRRRRTLYKGYCNAEDVRNRKAILEVCPRHNRMT